MGVIYKGFCHEDENGVAEASAGVGPEFLFVNAAGDPVFIRRLAASGTLTNGAVAIEYVTHSAGSVETTTFNDFVLATCSAAYENQFMPWADEVSVWDQMTPQLAGAMSLATAVLWGGAWAWRITRALS